MQHPSIHMRDNGQLPQVATRVTSLTVATRTAMASQGPAVSFVDPHLSAPAEK
jgi:hypothetical protein